MKDNNYYSSQEAQAYVTAINILAVEYLLLNHDNNTYGLLVQEIDELTDDELIELWIAFDLNNHISTLGAMVSHGEYKDQLRLLISYLEYVRAKKQWNKIMEK